MRPSASLRSRCFDDAAPYRAIGTLTVFRAAAPGRPQQGPTLTEGRSTYSARGVNT